MPNKRKMKYGIKIHVNEIISAADTAIGIAADLKKLFNDKIKAK